MNIRSLSLAAALVIATLPTWAQTPPAGAASTPGVDARQAKQEARIDKGVASGSLTPREARRLERQQASVERAEARAKADGTVTKAERAHLHHKQDHASHRIHRQKHDRQRAASAPQ